MSHLYFIFSIIFKSSYTFVPNFTKRFEITVTATLGKNVGPPMTKWSNVSYLQENQELYTTCTLSMICQINVVNKELGPPLTIN